MKKLSKFAFFGSSLLWLWAHGVDLYAACACDPNVSFSNVPEVSLPVGASAQVDVNLGNSLNSFIQAAYEQINGTVPSAAIISQQTSNFSSNPWWRRIDTVNSFLNAANSNKTKIYSDPWQNDAPFNTAPCKNVTRDVGAVCMFFFGCVGGTNCQMDWANTHASGMYQAASILAYGSNPNGIYNAGVNTGFWYRELMDARYAGLQFLMPNVYGPDLSGNAILNLAAALANIAGQGLSNQVKIALFDDTSGWNSGNPAPWNNPPSFSNPSAAASAIFNNKWKPFFQGIPSAYWYTVNGRPLIYFYNAGTLTPLNQSAATISQLKSLFNTQFGVTPYVVVDRAYFADPAMQSTADNEFVWDTLHNGLPNNLSSYSFSGIRWDHAMVKWDPLGRNYYGLGAPNIHIANSGDGLIKDDSYLISALYNSGPSGDNANVLVIATWNDLGEGTGINRNYDYYWNGQWQPPNVFMNDIRASQSQQSCGTILPTMAPTPVQTPLVSDFETLNAQNKLTEWNSGNILTAKDSYGTTMAQNPWTYASSVAGNGSAHAGRISGTLAPQIIASNQYPFAYLALELTPGGSIPSNANVNVLPESPNQGLHFDFKAGAAGVQYRVDLVEHDGATVFNYTYFQFVFTSPDTNWHGVDVYFPNVSGGGFHFSRPGGGTFDPTVLGAVLFQVQPQNGASVNYDLTVDNVTFSVPPAPPAIGGPLITNFDSNNAMINAVTEWNNGHILTARDNYGTTLTQNPWKWSTGTGPGNPGVAGRISGSLAQQLTATAQYPYAYLGLELTPNGSIPGNANVNVLPYAPNQGLEFDYKAGAAGVQYRVDLVEHDGATTFSYNYFQYVWTAPDTNWHTVDVYFPNVVGGANHFSRPGGGVFDPTVLGAVLFQVQPQNGSTVNYDLSVDNVSFNAPPPPTPTATPSPSSSPTATATPSASPTASFSPTALVPSPSATPTDSTTATMSPSPSLTASFTTNSTPSFTPSATPSLSPTPSGTASATRTSSPSASVSPTFSSTATTTASPTPVPTGSTKTDTPTISPTFSASPTATLSVTPGSSSTASPTFSPSVTPSFTRSPSSTFTVSASPSGSPTSLVPSPSNTPTLVLPTASFTTLPSATNTAQATATRTALPSSTFTALPTASVTPLPPSATPTAFVPSFTFTPTSSIQTPAPGTATPSAQPSALSTATPSLVATPASGAGQAKVLKAVAWPNPNPGAVQVLLQNQASQLTLKVYSAAMVLETQAISAGPLGPGWVGVKLPDAFIRSCPSGTYFYKALSGSDSQQGATGGFVVLK